MSFLINPFTFAVAGGDFESIATVTVGSGGAADIEFTSIPGTYQHLQIRCIYRSDRSATSDSLDMQFNSDTGSNYAYHQLRGNGSSVIAGANSSYSAILVGKPLGATAANTDAFSASIIDILDYVDTSKNTTVRAISGAENNVGYFVSVRSGLWVDTTSISSIKIFSQVGDLTQYSTFSLFGIKA